MECFKDWNRKEFYIKYWIVIVVSIVFFISCVCYFVDILDFYSFDKINEVIVDKFLVNREGILVSIAAIFIGIYFTLFTLLLTIKPESKIIQMGLKTYKELLTFIKHAFIGAFLYLFYVILYPLINFGQAVGLFKFLYEVVLSGLILYMLLSAVRVGIAYFIIFKFDLESFIANIDKEKQYKEEKNEIIFKLESFLDEVERQEAKRKAEEINLKAPLKNPRTTKQNIHD